MPGPKPWKQERDAEIRRLYLYGATLAEIAALYGITKQRVSQILAKG